MKKGFFGFVLILALFVVLQSVASAVGESEYQLDDLDMTIDIPSNLVVFTRDISVNDPNLSVYGLNRNDLLAHFESARIYLDALPQDAQYEVFVTMFSDTNIQSVSNLNENSTSEVSQLIDATKASFESNGITFIDAEVYNHPSEKYKFIKIHFERPDQDETVPGVEYYTVINGKAILIILQSYTGPITSSMEDILSQVVNSSSFTIEPVAPLPTTYVSPSSTTSVAQDMKSDQYVATAILSLVLNALLAFIPAYIGKSKGRRFGLWWLYGFFFWLIAIIHVLVIKKKLDNECVDMPYEGYNVDKALSKVAHKQEAMAEGEEAGRSVAYFSTRDIEHISCPECHKDQKTDRDSCFSCGCQFKYGVPVCDQQQSASSDEDKLVAPVTSLDDEENNNIEANVAADIPKPKFCRKCGAPIQFEDSQFCSECGNTIRGS